MRLTRRGNSLEGSEQLTVNDLAGLKNLLALTLDYEPSERATADEIVKLDWVQQLLRELESKQGSAT